MTEQYRWYVHTVKADDHQIWEASLSHRLLGSFRERRDADLMAADHNRDIPESPKRRVGEWFINKEGSPAGRATIAEQRTNGSVSIQLEPIPSATAQIIVDRHNKLLYSQTPEPEEPKPAPEKPGLWHFDYCVEDHKTLTCGYVKSDGRKSIYHVRPGSADDIKTAISHHNKFVGENT